jgi:glycerol uptake facilitator protein
MGANPLANSRDLSSFSVQWCCRWRALERSKAEGTGFEPSRPAGPLRRSVSLSQSRVAAYINPAFTLGMAFSVGDSSKFPPFLVAQVVGASVGAVLVWLHFLRYWRQSKIRSLKLPCVSTMPTIRNFGANLLTCEHHPAMHERLFI